MNDEQFKKRLDSHGTDLSRWPAPERAAAEWRLEASTGAKAAWRAAMDVERLLSVPPEVEDERVDRLVAAVARRAREVPRDTVLVLLLGRMPVRLAGALCALLLALGWLAGSLALRTEPGGDVAFLSDDVPTLFDGASR
ncbi:hypothetical protein [Azospirillum sp. sgz302134]